MDPQPQTPQTAGRNESLNLILKAAREQKGLSLDAIADKTHVRKEHLVAIEEGRYGDLPEDVYSKNFVRLYAKAVGIDEARALLLFARERGRLGLTEPAAPAGEMPERTPTERRSLRTGAWLWTILLAGVLVGVALWAFNSMLFRPDVRQPVVTEVPDTGTPDAETPDTTAQPEEVVPAPPEEDETPLEAAQQVRLTIVTTPPGAEASIDNFPFASVTPITQAPVTAGENRLLRLTLEGYPPYEETLDLSFDRSITVDFDRLVEEAAAEAAAAAAAEAEAAARAEATAQEAAADAAQASATTSPTSEPDAAEAETPATDTEAASGTAAATAPSSSEGQLALSVSALSWLEVYQSTQRGVGERLVYTMAEPGTSYSFELPVFLHVGNAAGIQVSVGGQDLGAMGSSGEVVSRAYTAP